MKKATIANNAVIAKLIDADRETKLLISALLSYTVEGCEHSASFKSGRWDGRSSFFDYAKATFPAGFSHLVHSQLIKHSYAVNRVRKPLPVPLGPEHPVVDEFPEDPRYDYQPQVVDKLLKHGQIIAQVATGGGKSRIAKLCYARIQRPTLFLTTRGILMYQMKDSFEGLGKAVGVMGDNEWSPRRGVNVGMVQTLVARLENKTLEGEIGKLLEREVEAERKHDKSQELAARMAKSAGVPFTQTKFRKKTPKEIAAVVKPKLEEHQARREKTIKILELFEFIILEEAHEASGNSYYEIMRHCKNAYYRLALTATPFMKDAEESNMRLMACSGPIGIKVSEKLLIDRGILAKPYFKYIVQPNRPDKVYRTTPWRQAYKNGISHNEWRNRAIIYEAKRTAALGLPTMVLIQHQEHGKLLLEMMRAEGLRAEFIFGEHNQDERQSALARLKSGKIDALIGSTILDVGVDVPAVGMIILAGGGKAEVALRQRIGRGLRAKKIGPNVCMVVDFMDEHNNHTRSHAMTRLSIVKGTEGFVENVLAPGQDFDFVAMGLDRMAA